MNKLPRFTIGVWLVGIVVLLFTVSMRIEKKPRVVAPTWPDPRAVRWESVSVGGYQMVKPDGTQVTLPPGAILSLPHPTRVGQGDSVSTFVLTPTFTDEILIGESNAPTW